MRPIIVLLVAAWCATALAQTEPYCYVQIEVPAPAAIAVIHPSQAASLFLDGGEVEPTTRAVRVGESSWDPWGECYFESPLWGATSVIVQCVGDPGGTLDLLDEPLVLDALVDSEGWTTVDLAQLRGGGYSDGVVPLVGRVPDYAACGFSTFFYLDIRSPDINGDLAVDLSDIVLFIQALGEYRAYADLRPDGVVNLSDIVIMSQGIFGD